MCSRLTDSCSVGVNVMCVTTLFLPLTPRVQGRLFLTAWAEPYSGEMTWVHEDDLSRTLVAEFDAAARRFPVLTGAAPIVPQGLPDDTAALQQKLCTVASESFDLLRKQIAKRIKDRYPCSSKVRRTQL